MTTEQTRIKRRIADLARYKPDSVEPPFPKTIFVEVSNLCNHKCVFCAYPKATRPGKRIELPLIERLLREAYDLGTREAGFYSGAEPFTSPDLEQIVKLAKDIGYEYVFVSTNGSLANEKRLTTIIDNGLDSIKFSINAVDRETYRRIHGLDHFDRVLGYLKFASEYRKVRNPDMYIAASFVVIDNAVGSNAAGREKIHELIGHLVDEIVFFDACNENGQMMGLAPMDVEAPCALPFSRLHVSAEGHLRMCCNDYQNYLSLADLNHTTIREAWYSDIFKEMRQRHLDKALQGTLCHNCINNVNTPIEPVVPALAVRVDAGFFDFERQHLPLLRSVTAK